MTIAELLAKGISNLTPEELNELDVLLRAEADRILDADAAVSDDDLVELQKISGHINEIKVENGVREQAEADRTAERDRLAAEIRGVADEPVAEVIVDEVVEDVVDEPVDEKVPVTASAEPVPAPRPVAVPRPSSTAPRRTNVQQAALTAAANVPGVVGGTRLDNKDRVFAAFDAAASLAASASGVARIPVATSRVQYPEELSLDTYAEGNEAKIQARTSLAAITASGGICAPTPFRYDLPHLGDNARPIRDSLVKFGVQRGGIRTIIPPTIADVSSTTAGPISQWTEANDQAPSSPATKPYLTIACGNTESNTKVYAITESFKIGNFRDKWFPEQVAAYMDLAAVWQARYAESMILKTIAAGSKVVTHGQVLGSAQDTFTALRQLIAGIRYRNRIPAGQPFRVIGFEWVRDNIITDLVRKGRGDLSTEARLKYAYAELDAFFRVLNCNITWTPDFENGRAIGQNGGPLAGVQGVGPIIGYPSQARFYVHLEGQWLFLDGGQLDLGVIRDTTLVGTNDLLMFNETFENVHYHGIPGETYVFDVDICANGAYANGSDITVCVSGS